jgi:hypothetical protein
VRTGYFPNVGGLPYNFSYDKRLSEKQRMFLWPQSIQNSEPIEIPSQLARDVVGKREGGIDTIYAFGIAEYRDVFDDKIHYTRWCYRLSFRYIGDEEHQIDFIQSGDYNQTDDEGVD